MDRLDSDWESIIVQYLEHLKFYSRIIPLSSNQSSVVASKFSDFSVVVCFTSQPSMDPIPNHSPILETQKVLFVDLNVIS